MHHRHSGVGNEDERAPRQGKSAKSQREVCFVHSVCGQSRKDRVERQLQQAQGDDCDAWAGGQECG